MNKYIAIAPHAAFDSWGYYDESHSIAVTEAERPPVNTGLLNEYGTPLYRVSVREPIGFKVGRGGRAP